jgi:Xaa-Pro aminopeptidase
LAINKIRPGLPISEIDAAARDFITSKGYGKNFGHSLGHGVGLEVHEAPRVSGNNKDLLKEGMVFTIEPAIYLPRQFGIRLEDMVLVTKKGAKVLNDCLFD